MTSIVFAAVLAGAPAVIPLHEPAPKPGQWGYRPADGERVAVNPPSLCWVHDKRASTYEVSWAREDQSRARRAEGLPFNTYTHDEPLAPGTYTWQYRFIAKDGTPSGWSRLRTFVVPEDAVAFPMPGREEQARRVPKEHPRLFLRPEDVARIRARAKGELADRFRALVAEAERVAEAPITPEPTVRGAIRNLETRSFWWANRVQALKACGEAEITAFAYLLTEDERLGRAARDRIVALARWDPDGPTNFSLNDEAAMPLLHRLARAYDWAYAALSEDDRALVRKAVRRRCGDAYASLRRRPHLDQPYGSHQNRIWHKLGEAGIAFLGEIPEAADWLDHAVNVFFAAYPVWCDDDGGWHEGLSYWAGYMTKVVWWFDVARSALEIDGMKKPFFSRFGDYGLYVAPPGSPNMGFGDLSYRPPSGSWGTFVSYFARLAGNGHWLWWTREYGARDEGGILGFFHALLPAVAPVPPTDLPPSKFFRGIGVAALGTSLLSAKDDVRLLVKSSPFGRQSHGHDAQNSFLLNAYGEAVLANCVFRDWHGSPFHTKWCWSTRAQNAVLVDGEGQTPHGAAATGRIAAWKLGKDVDRIVCDAAPAYGGRLTRALRHIAFFKPETIVILDDLEAPKPATFQVMLHAFREFRIDEKEMMLNLDGDRIRAAIRLAGPEPLALRQWTGYDPPPDADYMKGRTFPAMWHVEAGTREKRTRAAIATVVAVARRGSEPEIIVERKDEDGVAAIIVRRGGRTYEARFRLGEAAIE
ncbi:MAG: DUF4962 domain-containing protein [Planctomycetes bacterium]|nr:DUF4962 domain-containing protein [Planctomycetota bacterium]